MKRLTLVLVTANLLVGATLAKAEPVTVITRTVYCHWHLRVTGGQRPGSPVVLWLTNPCYPGRPAAHRVGSVNVP